MKKTFVLFFASFCFGMISAVLWSNPAHGAKGGAKACGATLEMCTSDLDTCNDQLAACPVFPGDGYADPSFGTIGHGPALSYTDNGDGTFTDNNTGYMWEIKDNSGGVHDVDNYYSWTDTSDNDNTDPDGTLFTEFLAELNDEAGGGINCFAEHCDWCIPNVKRLQSIVNYSQINPPRSSVPGENGSDSYWSSTTFGGVPNWAFVVDFDNGEVFVIILDDGKGALKLARAVRPCE